MSVIELKKPESGGVKTRSILTRDSILIFFIGCLTATIYAPLSFFPALLGVSYLVYRVKIIASFKDSFFLGLKFGLGYNLVAIYWISLALRVYIDEFWWAFPFALFGLPLVLACFTALTCAVSNIFKNSNYYPFLFSMIWVFYEWTSSWIFTGLPWVLIGYSLSFSLKLQQIANFFGVFGLSFILVYVFANLYYLYTKEYKKLIVPLVCGLTILLGMYLYGKFRLANHPSEFSNLSIRLVQPSIEQEAKWDLQTLNTSLDNLEYLSKHNNSNIDLIIWPESALILPVNHPLIHSRIVNLIECTNSILMTGSVVESGNMGDDDFKLYTAMQVIDRKGDILAEYYKSHLVPFGEYMPFKNFIPIKKLTHGFIDYTEGDNKLVYLKPLNIILKGLICYESIFPALVRKEINSADIIINITNDAWYGNSSGPYQHLQINVMRAIENGMPILRSANNGITAVIDPMGRIISALKLNEVNYLDSKMPLKLKNPTLYSQIGELNLIILLAFLFLSQFVVIFLTKSLIKL